MRPIYRYKSLRVVGGRLFSWYGNDDEWRVGEWRKLKGKIRLCANGFHVCRSPSEVRGFTQHGQLFRVEVRGRRDANRIQEAWSEMRVVEPVSEDEVWYERDAELIYGR